MGRFLRWYAGPWGLLAHWLVMPWVYALAAGLDILVLPEPINWLGAAVISYFALTWQPWRAARKRYRSPAPGREGQ